MIKVGITGGIGSGKTTLCKEWEEQGVYVVYADDFAKELMNTDAELKADIISSFGESSYDADGNLNRPYLAKEAFEKGRVQELNKLVHPVLWSRLHALMIEKEQEGLEVFAEEAAILLQNGRPENLDYIVLVQASQTNRMERVMQRDKAEAEKVMARMSKQPDFDTLTHLCDFIVVNDGSLEELKEKSRKLLQKIKQIE